jgi:hypothetical protein
MQVVSLKHMSIAREGEKAWRWQAGERPVAEADGDILEWVLQAVLRKRLGRS